MSLATAMDSFAAPRQAEHLDRGVVALPSGNGIFVSWRFLGNDPGDIATARK